MKQYFSKVKVRLLEQQLVLERTKNKENILRIKKKCRTKYYNKNKSIKMMDEKLIGEVQQHAVIYNRQKSNTMNGGDKCITKELAWQNIARNLGSDVDTCKKRWKYLRERYVQQKKVGGSPASYEHLSRPYLEKMKFLDAFIQSRKSYRATGLFTNPTSIMHATFDESSKSNGSMRLNGTHLNPDNDDAFSQFYQMNAFSHGNLIMKSESDSATNDMHHLKKHSDIRTGNMPSSSSSIASQESPATLLSNSTTHEIDDSSSHSRKRRRITNTSISGRNGLHKTELNHAEELNLSENDEDPNSINNDDASDQHQSSPLDVSPTNIFEPLYNSSARFRRTNEMNSTTDEFANPADLLHPLYQQAIARQFRNSDQLLGELVTSELIKMSKDRKKMVQKKILGILFFDDD